VQRTRLSTVLASLGLGACELAPGQAVEPEAALEGAEPSGRGESPKPTQPSSRTSTEPHFEGVPTQFCSAGLQQRDQSLLRTESFLQAWNELAPPIRNQLAHNIPATEIDARMFLCGAERCSLGAAKLTEVVADYMVGVGVLLPADRGMLVVPEVGAAHTAGSCTNKTEIHVEQQGELVHVRALNVERRYNYGHGYGGHYGGYAYEPAPMECRSYAVHRRDLVIDVERGELELIIDQHHGGEGEPTWVELAFTSDGIVLSGCASTLALQWTG
jgi:hypothetical protein